MTFSNSTKHSFSGGEISPSLRGRSDINAYYDSVERLENFVPDTKGQIYFREGNEYVKSLDTGAVSRDLSADKDIRIYTLNINTMDLVEDISDRLESIKVGVYRVDTVDNEIGIDVTSSIYGDETLAFKYDTFTATGLDQPNPTINGMDGIQVDQDLVLINPASTYANRVYYDVLNSVWKCEYATIRNYPFYPFQGSANYPYTHNPRPVGVFVFENRLSFLSSRVGTIHFGSSPNPDTGFNRYYDFIGRELTLPGAGGQQQYNFQYTFAEWRVASSADFSVYLEDRVTFVRTKLTLTTDYTVIDHSGSGYFTIQSTDFGGFADAYDNTLVLVRNEGYADDGFSIQLRTITPGENLLWAIPVKNFIVVGSASGLYSISSSDGSGLSATNFKVEILGYTGSSTAKPIAYKEGFIYIDNSKRNFQYLRYDFINGGYKAVGLNDVQKNVLPDKISSVAFSSGNPDLIYVVTEGYDAFIFTISPAGEAVGFCRLKTTVPDGITDIYTYFDIREQNMITVFSFQNDETIYIGKKTSDINILDFEDFYTGNKSGDAQNYYTYLYDILKDSAYLDLHIKATSANSVVMPSAFEGLTVNIVADGVYKGEYVVPTTPYTITLDTTYETIYAGFKYNGLCKTNVLSGGGIGGEAWAKQRVSARVIIQFLNTLGAKFGFDLYDLQEVIFTDVMTTQVDRPPNLFSGIKELLCTDIWGINKNLYVLQENPYPCTIQRVDIYGDVSNE